MTGSLAPPPPYGSEQGDILLEAGRKDDYSGSAPHGDSNVYSQSASRGGGPGLNPQTGHGRTRSGNFRVLPPRSPGPIRSPTDISLAHFVPSDEGGEPSGTAPEEHHATVGLGMQDALNPPPDYTSPEGSESGSRRNSEDSEDTPLIRVVNRSRGSSAVAAGSGPFHPPIPSYSDAVREGARREDGNDNDNGRSTPSQRHYSRSRSQSAM